MTAQTLESDVLLARDGDHAAFHRIVEQTGTTVCSIALAISRDVHASEDIAQETFLAAWSGLKQLRNPTSFLPWLRQMTRNQAHLWRRRHGRDVTNESAIAAAVDARRPVDEELIDGERRALIEQVLSEIDDESREVLVLYYREGSSTRQVATLLGINEDAVRQRLSRSRARLREGVLERFGTTMRATAPGASFAAAVAGALLLAAPPATAAVAASAAATTNGVAAAAATLKAALLGGLLGWLGVLMGMRYLEPVYDDQEQRELRRFRNLALFVVTLGSIAIALSAPSTLAMLITIQSTYAAVLYLYAVRLPKILERRMSWERSVNPDVAAQSRGRWMWSTIRESAAAAIAGSVLMAILLRALF